MAVLMEAVAESGKGNITHENKLSCANGDKENPVFPVHLTTSRIGNHTRLMPSLLKVVITHTYTWGGSITVALED